MKFSYLLIKIIFFFVLVGNLKSIAQESNEEIQTELFINYDIGKSAFHLINGGYSFDFETIYSHPIYNVDY